MTPKIVAVIGSPRKGGNTEALTKIALGAAAKEGCKTEIVSLYGKKIRGCQACGECWHKKDRKCHGPKDNFHAAWEKIKTADGLILASPVYFGSCYAELRALMDRAENVSMANHNILAGKVGAPVIAARRAGTMTAYSQMAMFYPINGMILLGNTYWNVGFGLFQNEARSDMNVKETLQEFGTYLAKVLHKLAD